MASIRDYTVTEYVAAAATWTPDMPVHATGDLLVAFLGKDSTTGWSQSTDWSEYIDQATAQANVGCQCRRAASSSEVFSVTLTSETGVVVILSIKDCYGSSLADALNLTPVVAGADATTIPYAGVTGQSTTQNNCLLLYAFGADGGISPTAYSPAVNLYCGDAANGSLGVAYSFQAASGAIAENKWFGRGNDDGRAMLVAVRSNGSGSRQGYSDPAISSTTVLRPLVGLSTMQSDSWPTAVTITALGEDFEANSVYIYEVAPSWADDTTDANDPGTADVAWPMHVGDMVYFGHSSKFKCLSFITSTAGGGSPAVAWEYWNGAWTAASGMAGTFAATGGARVAFTNEFVPSDWVPNDPGMGYSKYWVRCRITTAYTTNGPTQSQIRLNGYIAAYIVATASADAGTNPYTDACANAGASSTTSVSGCQITFGAALNMGTGIIMGTVRPTLPRDFAIDLALPSKPAGGVQVSFFDASNNCLSYKIGAKGCKTLDVDGRNVYAIGWNGTATPWAICGSISKSAITYMYLTTLGYYGAAATQWSMLVLVSVVGIAGGSSSAPLNLSDMSYVVNNSTGRFPLIKQTGSACMIYSPLQFGGGDPVFINCNLNTLQFPKRYDGLDYFDWNVAENIAGVKFYPKSGDSLVFTNCVFTSEDPYRWEFDASSATSGTVLNFSGSSVVKGTVTLRSGIGTFDNMSFVNCPSFTQNGATITNSSFSNTKVIATTLNTMSSCTFTKDGTQHAIYATQGGIYNFTGNSFIGYQGDGSAYSAIHNGTHAKITLNVSGGISPSYLNQFGDGTTVINNNVTITLTGLKNPSEVRVFSAGTTNEIAGTGAESVTDGDHQFSVGNSVSIDIVILALGYQNMRILNYSTSSNAAIPVSQVLDRQYNNS